LHANAPNQVYCWDITYLPSAVRGVFYYLYLYVDLYSRAIVGWQVFDREGAQQAADLLIDICRAHMIKPDSLTVHSDNGSPMKGETMLATMQALGVAHTRSRPAVSNDNPYSEALFKTLKYRPQLPVSHFESIGHARAWVTELVAWYNTEHRHSSIRFVTPAQRHKQLDHALLDKRHALYQSARATRPNRWSQNTRNWQHISVVHLNPDNNTSPF
jgi:transposase InsO family protein